jgi:prepilin-type N-terminal cleavage/methylation domain-containing protein
MGNWLKRKLKINREQGFSLIEVLMATMLLAICAAGLLVVLTQTSRLLLQVNLKQSARNLATAQLEYIKNEGYLEYSNSDPISYAKDDILDSNYGFTTTVSVSLPGPSETVDEGVQKITLTVTQGDSVLTTLEGYKAQWNDEETP